jgi:two-component system chemotaxis response regulator CheB
VLNEVHAEGSTRFRCQIGHGFTPDGLLAAQDDELERALESAIRIHRDRVVLFRRLHQKTLPGMPLAAARWKAGAEESEHAARMIEGALQKLRRGPEETSPKPAIVQDSPPDGC